MAIIAPKEGLIKACIANYVDFIDTSELFLFTAPATPDADTENADIVEPTFPGYAPISGLDWSFPPTIEGGKAVTKAGPQFFVHAGGAGSSVVIGWGLRTNDGKLILLELFAAPVTMDSDNDTISLVPEYSVGDDPDD